MKKEAKIKAGVIGAGFIGPVHVESLRRLGNVDVVALADHNHDLAYQNAHAMSIPKSYGDWQELILDPDVEVVHNCTPNNIHFEINKAALQAGKPIVSEKPLAMNSQESAELLQLSTRLGVPNEVCFTYRMYPIVQQMKSMVECGEVGQPWIVWGSYLQDWLWAETDYHWKANPVYCGPTRVMADIGSHWCEVAQFVSGQNIVSVCAEFGIFHPTRKAIRKDSLAGHEAVWENIPITTEDYGAVLVDFSNGMKGTYLVSQVSAGHKNDLSLEINGSGCSIGWNQEDPERLWIGRRDEPDMVIVKDNKLLHDNVRQYSHYPVGHPEGFSTGFKNLFQAFYKFLRSDSSWQPHPKEFPTFWEGHRSMLIIDAILTSAKERRWVDVDFSTLTSS